MKKWYSIATAVLLLFFFTVFSIFPSPFDCSAKIILYNEFPFDIIAIIDGHQKNLYGWGQCRQLMQEDKYRIIPCSRTWVVKWSGYYNLGYCFGLWEEEDEEYEQWYDEQYGPDDEEEKFLNCEEYSVRIAIVDVEGLDNTVTLKDERVYEITVGTSGLVMRSSEP